MIFAWRLIGRLRRWLEGWWWWWCGCEWWLWLWLWLIDIWGVLGGSGRWWWLIDGLWLTLAFGRSDFAGVVLIVADSLVLLAVGTVEERSEHGACYRRHHC